MTTEISITGELNQTGLTRAVAARTGRTLDESAETVQAVLDVIGVALAAGHTVKISNFASLVPTTHTVAAGALGGRVTEAYKVNTVKIRLNGRLHDAVRNGTPVTTLRKSAKSC